MPATPQWLSFRYHLSAAPPYRDSDRVEFTSPTVSVTGPDADNLYTVTLDISNLAPNEPVK